MKKYLIIDTDAHESLFYDDAAAAADNFESLIANPDHRQNIILMEIKLPRRAGAPKAKIIGVRSQGFVVGNWMNTSKKLHR